VKKITIRKKHDPFRAHQKGGTGAGHWKRTALFLKGEDPAGKWPKRKVRKE